MMATALVLAFYNIYNYIWRKKLYAVKTMAFLYLCIPFTVIARMLNFGYLCRYKETEKAPFFSVNFANIGMILITIILCTNLHEIYASLLQLQSFDKSKRVVQHPNLRKLLLLVTAVLLTLTLTATILVSIYSNDDLRSKAALLVLVILFYLIVIYFVGLGCLLQHQMGKVIDLLELAMDERRNLKLLLGIFSFALVFQGTVNLGVWIDLKKDDKKNEYKQWLVILFELVSTLVGEVIPLVFLMLTHHQAFGRKGNSQANDLNETFYDNLTESDADEAPASRRSTGSSKKSGSIYEKLSSNTAPDNQLLIAIENDDKQQFSKSLIENTQRENIVKNIKATGFLRRDFTEALLRAQTFSEDRQSLRNSLDASAASNFFQVDHKDRHYGSDQLTLQDAQSLAQRTISTTKSVVTN